MANTLAAAIPQILAQGLLALRQQAVMPRLVNSGYSEIAGEKGTQIDIPIPSAVATRTVTNAAVPPQAGDSSPTKVSIAMSQWIEAPFYLSDKDILEAMRGIVPMQSSEAVKALANNVDAYILGTALASGGVRGVSQIAGAAGTTPFASDVSAYSAARKLLNAAPAPFTDRRVVLDVNAEANVLALPTFLQAYSAGDQKQIVQGIIGTKMGADWYLDQNVKTQATTTASAGAITVNGVNAVAASGVTQTISLAKATNPTNLIAGDILTITNQAGTGNPGGTFVVLAAVTLAVGNTTVSIFPALTAATAGGEAVTLTNAHVCNVLFHRDAF